MPWVEDDSEEVQVAGPAGRWVEDDTPTLTDQLARQIGLTGRAAITGITGIPAMVGSALNAAVNYSPRLPGSYSPRLGMADEGINEGLNRAGLPQPQNTIERLNQVGGSALTGAGALGLAGRAAAGMPTASRAFTEMARAPAMQAVGAVTGAGAVEGAQQAGVQNPLALMGIGMIGSIAGGGTEGALGGVRAAAAPLTRVGRDVIVGRALNKLSTTPSATADRLANPEIFVPGSMPTVSQAGRDPGLAGAESALRGLDERNLMGQRASQQNRARQEELYKVAGDETTVATAKASQKAAYNELAVPAFAKKVPTQGVIDWENSPVKAKIDTIRKSPKGARKSVRDALDEVEARLTDEDAGDLTDAERLYAIREDLALARDGKLVGKGKTGGELANLKTARSQLDDVIRSLDDVIETGAPGFKNYLKVYAERSVPLDQLKAAQALRARSQNAIIDTMDPQGNIPILSNSFGKIFRDNLDKGLNLRGKGPKAGNLTEGQLQTIQRVADDIDRGAAAQAATVRVPGSDTFKNMSVAGVIGRILGDTAADLASDSSTVKTLVRPLNFLYRVPDEQIQQLMIEAWLDPRLASQLMRRATESDVQSVAAQLGKRLGQQAAANALYGSP